MKKKLLLLCLVAVGCLTGCGAADNGAVEAETGAEIQEASEVELNVETDNNEGLQMLDRTDDSADDSADDNEAAE